MKCRTTAIHATATGFHSF